MRRRIHRRRPRYCAGAAAAAILLGAGACQKGEPLPDLGALPAFRLTSQAGEPFTRRDILGRAHVADFFFTSCTTICPALTRRMAEIARATEDIGDRLGLLSISVDPETDTPAVLRRYARAHGADARRWTFLTGRLDAIRRAVVEGFRVGLDRGPPGANGRPDPASIFHSSRVVLIDRKGHIRGYYPVETDAERDRIVADARRLAR